MESIIFFLKLTENVVFFYLLISAAYLGIYSLFSLLPVKIRITEAVSHKRFVILIPAYKEDRVVFDSVNSILNQNYPQNKVIIVVISDGMSAETNQRLSAMPVKNIVLETSAGSKANAMIIALEKLDSTHFDVAVIMDADNVASDGFLSDLNNLFSSGARAVQAHRTAKNLNNSMAILDAVSEEINNSIFRKGHVNMGVSSALIGSGMALEYDWFSNHVKLLSTAGEDKELELMLLREKIFIHYLDKTFVYDEKTQKEKVFYNQRRRWVAAQIGSLKTALTTLPQAVLSFNTGYIDKVLQWMLLPRVLMLGITGLIAVIMTIASFESAVKWWALLAGILLILIISVPSFLWTRKTLTAVVRLPWVFILMMLTLFRIKGVNKKFIHTEKG